ncbi:MAG TPA: ATP-binding protein [Candidatus Krumholzibacteria bacterium]|jgi:two-component system sensor histidine kinase PilS (NtrC family)
MVYHESEDTLSRWLFLRLAMATLVTSAGVVLLAVAAEGVSLQPLMICVAAQCAVVLSGFLTQLWISPRIARLGEAVLDVVIITACIHYSGGVGSPFAVLYFFPILLAAYSFGPKGAVATASFATVTFLSYVFSTAAGWLPVPEVQFRGDDLSSAALLRGYFEAALLLIVGYLAAELSARIGQKETLLQQRTEQLERTELETQSILGNMSSGVLTLDREAKVRRVNQAAEKILGVSAQELIGRPLGKVLDAQMPLFVSHLSETLRGGGILDRVELNVERADGSSLPLGLSISQRCGPSGEKIGIIAVFQDLSSVLRMREQIRANDRLAAMGELSASIAHEIRNPLASIRGSVEMLASELNVDGENRRLMDLVLKESGRLNRLIEDFLEYARLKPLHRRNCRLQPLLDELDTLLSSRNQPFDLRIPQLPHDLVLHMDEELVKQVFLNLAINAVEAMDGGGTLEIAVGVRMDGGQAYAAIRFLDEGCGIAEHSADRLFEPFFTTKPKGTGLGLPLANRIITGHEGRIEIRNRDGGGAECAVHLPLVGVWRDGKLEHGMPALELESVSADAGIGREAKEGLPTSSTP